MTVSLTGTGGAFTRAGAIAKAYNNFVGIAQSTSPSPSSAWGASGPTIIDVGTQFASIEAQFQSTNQQLVDKLFATRDAARTSILGNLSPLAALTSATFVKVCQDDVGGISTLAQAVTELRRQMLVSSDTIKGPTVTITGATGSPSPTGTATVTGSVKQKDGYAANFVYNETINLICTTDSLSGGATAGQETLTYTGNIKVGYTDVLWPQGSSASGTYTVLSASGSAQLATNGNFDTFSTNTPGTWTLDTGAAGTNVYAEATDVYITGGKALKITGDAGLTLTTLSQAITGLKGQDVLACNAFVHVDAAAPAAGKLRFALVDGSNTVINDDAGTANNYTVDLTQSSLQTTYVATGAMTTTQLNGGSLAGGSGGIYFRLPSNMPTAVKLQIKLTTAITNAKNVYVDELTLAKPTQLYGSGIAGGPYMAVFRGGTNLVAGDKFKLTPVNNYGGLFSKYFWRTFDLPSLQVDIPNLTSANTVADSLTQ